MCVCVYVYVYIDVYIFNFLKFIMKYSQRTKKKRGKFNVTTTQFYQIQHNMK